MDAPREPPVGGSPDAGGGRPAVYLAGPDGFTAAGLQWHRAVLVPAVRAAGLVPLSPWEALDDVPAGAGALGPPPEGDPGASREAALRVGAANTALIEACDGVLAVLDGPDVDSGTAAEIGYAARAGRPVVGLRTDRRRTGDSEGAVVNLQVEHFIVASGGSVHRDLAPALAELARLLRGGPA